MLGCGGGGGGGRDICKLSCVVGAGEEESEVVTSCSGSGGKAGTAQPASRVNLSRLLVVLVAGSVGGGGGVGVGGSGVTSQYFTGQGGPILAISDS